MVRGVLISNHTDDHTDDDSYESSESYESLDDEQEEAAANCPGKQVMNVYRHQYLYAPIAPYMADKPCPATDATPGRLCRLPHAGCTPTSKFSTQMETGIQTHFTGLWKSK